MVQQPFKIVENSQKQLPNNIEAEQSVIGSILITNEIFEFICRLRIGTYTIFSDK